MKKKIKDCTLEEFLDCKGVSWHYRKPIMALLTMLKHWNKESSCMPKYTERQWKLMVKSLDKDFIESEIEVEDEK